MVCSHVKLRLIQLTWLHLCSLYFIHHFNLFFMKQRIGLFLLATLFLMSSCVVHRTAGNSGKVPPGQAKKLTVPNQQNLFAPGQQKK